MTLCQLLYSPSTFRRLMGVYPIETTLRATKERSALPRNRAQDTIVLKGN